MHARARDGPFWGCKAMAYVDVGSTNPAQLGDVADLGNHEAWRCFRNRYDPLLRACCGRFGLDPHGVEDVLQATWGQVAARMESFVYDPDRSFRGWLWRVCHFVTMDHLRSRRRSFALPLGDRDDFAVEPIAVSSSHEEEDPWLSPRARLAREVQAAVRGRVKPHNWEAFWLYDVELWSIDEVAGQLGISHAAIHKAKSRVLRMLRDEARKRLGGTIRTE